LPPDQTFLYDFRLLHFSTQWAGEPGKWRLERTSRSEAERLPVEALTGSLAVVFIMLLVAENTDRQQQLQAFFLKKTSFGGKQVSGQGSTNSRKTKPRTNHGASAARAPEAGKPARSRSGYG
jgi:hypothetical protein